MRVATFNLQSGKPNGFVSQLNDTPSQKLSGRRIEASPRLASEQAVKMSAARLATLAPDVVCLQEVLGALSTPFIEQAGASWREFALARRRFNPRSPRSNERYGIAMYSRLPIVRSWRWWLPSWRSPLRRTATGTSLRVEEQRRAIVALMKDGAQPVLVCATHLAPASELGVRQLRWLEDRLEKLAQQMRLSAIPRLIVGDLNMRPEMLGNQTRYTVLAEGLTYPSGNPRTQIDHILGRGMAGGDSWTELMPISDHRALIADVHVVR